MVFSRDLSFGMSIDFLSVCEAGLISDIARVILSATLFPIKSTVVSAVFWAAAIELVLSAFASDCLAC